MTPTEFIHAVCAVAFLVSLLLILSALFVICCPEPGENGTDEDDADGPTADGK